MGDFLCSFLEQWYFSQCRSAQVSTASPATNPIGVKGTRARGRFNTFGRHRTVPRGSPALKKAAALFLFLFLSCGSPDESHLKYGTFSFGASVVRSWSAYTTLDENSCVLPISIVGNGYQPSGYEVSNLQSHLIKAVGAWTNAIDGNAYWRCETAYISFGPSPRAITVILYPYVIRGFANIGQAEIHIGRDIADGSNPYAERIVLHEMGHMFGLADTYTEPGYQQPINQPPGIMNNLYAVPGLTSDDIDGARALYDYMNGRGPFCRNGYAVGGAYENKNQVAFCVR